MEIVMGVLTFGLLAVTAWYAKTTKDLATIAKETAEDSAKAATAAEESAIAARDAARVAQSQIDPRFTGRVVSVGARGDWDNHVACIRIDSAGDSVVVRAVRIRRAFRKSSDGDLVSKSVIDDALLEPYGPDGKLPKRVHRDEHMLLTHNAIQEQRPDSFGRFILDIEYTFSEDGGAGGTRELIFDL